MDVGQKYQEDRYMMGFRYVSILVLMDVGQKFHFWFVRKKGKKVSILVLMDVGQKSLTTNTGSPS